MISFGLCCRARQLGDGVEPVSDDVEPLAGEVDRRAVGQMPAMRQAHAHHRVAGLQHREKDRLIRLRA
jgi:hypothetical protein